MSPNLAKINDDASPIIVDFTPAYDVEIWLELPEMGVLGWATLTDVDASVAIQPGPGAVVTGTFAHVSDAVIDLQIEDQPKPIGCTTTHPFWSVDRQDFVEAGRLQQGERVQLYNGETKRVVQKLPRPGPVNVYNLEVYAEHVYSVTPDGVLVHNTCPQENYVYLAIKDKDGFITQDTFERLRERSLNPKGFVVEYVGITNDFDRRKNEHYNNSKRVIVKFKENLDRNSALAIEQTLINFYGRKEGRKRNGTRPQLGGQLSNLINCIAPKRFDSDFWKKPRQNADNVLQELLQLIPQQETL